jgi:DNA-binding NarL/FixJ family response regulator
MGRERTAVVLDEQQLWLEALIQLLANAGVSLRKAHEVHRGLKTVVLSATDHPQQIESAFAAGASNCN